MSVITIIGAGMMGTALVFPASDNGNDVRLVGSALDDEVIAACRATGRHPKLTETLPMGVALYTFDQLDDALSGADFAICGVSSFGVDWFAENVLPRLRVPVLSVTKGMYDLEDGRLLTYPEYWKTFSPEAEICAIGGGCTSYELAAKDPTLVTFCGENRETLEGMRRAMETDYYHIELSGDVRGIEAAVALKNAYALSVSLMVGLNERRFGEGAPQHYNSQAALFMQSAREMRKLIRHLGGTDASVDVGIGDLYVTVFGGRTRMLGTLLGRGLTFAQSKERLAGITLESTVVAVRVARAVRKQAERGSIERKEFPALEMIDSILTRTAPVNIPWQSFTGCDK